jgi:hypothetical protein
MTSSENDQSTSDIVNKGGYLCLQKPFNPSALLNLVKKYTSITIPLEPQ